jgi:hypothetical protein
MHDMDLVHLSGYSLARSLGSASELHLLCIVCRVGGGHKLGAYRPQSFR